MPDFRAPATMALFAALSACTQMGEMAGEIAGGGGGDACGAAERQDLVGTSVGTLDPATLPDPNRVIFPGQAVTTDLSADRLNVEIGPDDAVARVYCG